MDFRVFFFILEFVDYERGLLSMGRSLLDYHCHFFFVFNFTIFVNRWERKWIIDRKQFWFQFVSLFVIIIMIRVNLINYEKKRKNCCKGNCVENRMKTEWNQSATSLTVTRFFLFHFDFIVLCWSRFGWSGRCHGHNNRTIRSSVPEITEASIRIRANLQYGSQITVEHFHLLV